LTTSLAVHAVFEWLALAVGAQLYRRSSGRSSLAAVDSAKRLVIVLGAVLGAAIGNKLAFFAYDPQALSAFLHGEHLLGGQSIVGGLLGGLLGVEICKRFVGIGQSTGDAFVVPILVGIIIGRCGCFLAGLADVTYGDPTTLPWGYDFGDGVRRHPTQIYDQLFALGLLVLFGSTRERLRAVPGLEFKLMLSAYLGWRLAIDSIKPKPFSYPLHLSGIQVLCLVALCVYTPSVVRAALRTREMSVEPQDPPLSLL
jgi:phosphatidylglycerol:prolipoprotein diacylglycerol transferase